ncbi:hypothetical protein CMT74_03395 [Elizabethkingia anophelis]|nr:hypothetical protein [Elizabethkingia anophelis]
MKYMPTETAFKYLNEVRFMALSNWSVGAILSDKVLYKDGFKLEPIGNLIIRNREKEILEDDKAYKQVTIKLYGKGVIQRGDELIFGKDIGTKNQFRISEGQFIMSKIDARNGAFGIVPAELEGAITTQDFLSYNINTEKILPEFFNLITGTKHFAELCQKASSGTTGRQRVDEKAFLGFRIPVPKISIQSEILNRYHLKLNESLTAAQNSEIELIKIIEVFKEVFTYSHSESQNGKRQFSVTLFSEIDRWDVWNKSLEIKSEFPIINLGSIITEISTGTTPPTSRKDYFQPQEVNFYTPSDIGESMELVSSGRFISKKAIEDNKARVFKKGTFLFVGIGTIGKVGIVQNEYACANQQITGFSLSEQVNHQYVFYYLYYHKDITSANQTKTTLPILNQENIKSIPIPMPPRSVQNKIAALISEIENKSKILQARSQRYKDMALKEFESAIFNID